MHLKVTLVPTTHQTLENARTGDFEAENKFKADLENIVEEGTKTVVGYLRWEKVKQTETNKNTGRAKSGQIREA